MSSESSHERWRERRFCGCKSIWEEYRPKMELSLPLGMDCIQFSKILSFRFPSEKKKTPTGDVVRNHHNKNPIFSNKSLPPELNSSSDIFISEGK